MSIDLDEAKIQRNMTPLWLSWTLATAIGMIIGFVVPALFVVDIELIWVRIFLPIFAGFLVGTAQWLVLRSYLTHSADWILAGGASWSIGFALGFLVIEILGGSIIGAILGYLIFGAIIGLIHWPVLRREIPNVVPWVAANMAGWAIGAFIGQWVIGLLNRSSEASQTVNSLITSGITGLIAGAITGAALIYIARQPERVPFYDKGE